MVYTFFLNSFQNTIAHNCIATNLLSNKCPQLTQQLNLKQINSDDENVTDYTMVISFQGYKQFAVASCTQRVINCLLLTDVLAETFTVPMPSPVTIQTFKTCKIKRNVLFKIKH